MGSDDQGRPAPTWLYGPLFLAYGVPSGFVTVTLAYVLAQAHIPVVVIAGLAALQLAPQTWKLLWAPAVDCIWSYKGWHIAASLLVAAGVAVSGFLPMTLTGMGVLSLVTLLTGVASTVVGMAGGGLIAHSVPEAKKGEASGWSQAGNLGGGGIGGGLGLWLQQHAGGLPVAGLVLGLICALCSLALFAMTEPAHDHRAPRVRDTAINVVKDLWALIRSRIGLLALVLILLPIGSGAASNLFAAIAGDWRASGDTVALVTGVVGGLASTVGCVIAGFAADRMDRKLAYILFAMTMAACVVGMAVWLKTPTTFIVFTLLYAVTNGFMYTAYYAVALEAAGKGAAATKIQLMSSATNLPLMVCTVIEGAVQTRAGSTAMLWSDAGLTVAGAVVFGLFALALTKVWKPAAAAAA